MQPYTASRHPIAILARLGLILALLAAMGVWPAAPAAARPVGPDDPAPAALPTFEASETSKVSQLQQFTAGGHVIGFGPAQVVLASLDHALRVEFVGAAGVMPTTADAHAAPSAEPAAGQGKPLGVMTYPNLWRGVSVEYRASDAGILKSTYTVAPGADATQIRLRYNVAVALQSDGSLQFPFESGSINESAPIAWQEIDGARVPVPVAFQLSSDGSGAGDEVGFRLGAYDPRYSLTIDPTYIWHTFYGWSGDNDMGASLTLDSSNNVYVTGGAGGSWNGPAGQAPLHAFAGGLVDIFVLKLKANGAYQWHTFYGSSAPQDWVFQFGTSIAVDGSGNVYVVGTDGDTWQGPAGQNPLHAHSAFSTGNQDIMVLKLDSNGAYQWHTYYGTVSCEEGMGVAIYGSSVYVAGHGFETWQGPAGQNPLHDHAVGGPNSCNEPSGCSEDIIVLKLDSNGAYQWHTFYGGTAQEKSWGGLAVDGSGNVYVAGWSDGTWGTPLHAHSGGEDIMALKLNSSGAYQWHTFYGSTGDDYARNNGLAVTASGDVYIAGSSAADWGAGNPAGPLHAYTGGVDITVLKLNSGGAYQWHTFYGSTGDDDGYGATVDSSGNVYVTGSSAADWGAGNPAAPLHAYTGASDIHLLQLNSSGAYQWHTFYGSASGDAGFDSAVDSSGGIYATGYSAADWGTGNPAAPLHAHSGGYDVVVLKLGTNPPANISGQVRNDADYDGNLADAESGINGVTITLYADDSTGKPTGAALATTTTDASGYYTFTNRTQADYVVVETNPSGYSSTNDKDGVTSNTRDQIAVALEGVNSTGNDFLDADSSRPADISGQVRYDTDNDGNLADAESGINGATVELYADDSTGKPIGAALRTTTTSSSGYYTFTSVAPGNYVVVETNLGGYPTSTNDKDGATSNTRDQIAVALAGVNSTGNDFLDTNAASISGQVRYDTDRDGDLTDAEGVGSYWYITIKLYADDGTGKPTGAALRTTTTDSSTGNYTFAAVTPGSYVVVETNLSGYVSTNDRDGATRNSLDQIAVALAGVDSTGNDFLDSNLANISGQVRHDIDGDGALADAESGISGVTVKLYNADGAGNPTGSPLATTTTDASGYYTFTNRTPYTYVVVETNPSGYTSTNDKDGLTTTNSYDKITVTLAGVDSTGNDFLDANGVSISGQVRWDADGDGNLADAESGISGVTITLYADDGTGQPTGAALRTTTTNSAGAYSFAYVPPGNYVIVETNLSGYISTNDRDGAFRNTRDQIAVTVGGQPIQFNDFLDVSTLSISGQVRWDADNDGNLADAESGINGVTIQLYADDGMGYPTGAVLATTTTDASGYYTFTNRAPGNYVVVETNPTNYTSTNDKDGFGNTRDQIAVALVAGVDNTGNDFLDTGGCRIYGQVRNDTDNNGNLADADSGISGVTIKLYANNGAGKPTGGVLATTTTDASGYYTFTNVGDGNYVVVEVNLGGYPTSTNDKDGAASNTRDQIAVMLVAGASSFNNDFLDTVINIPADISGQVRYDADNDGNLADVETGINGVTVELYADDGTGHPTGAALQTTATAGSGDYTFANVAAGNYVVVETNLSGYPTSTNDKDGAASNTRDQIAVALAGVNSTGNDFLDTNVANILGQVRYDTDRDGNLADAESGLGGLKVELYADDGAGKPTGAALRTTTTDGTGNYSLTNVAPGDYVVVETNWSDFTSTNDKDGATRNTRDQIAVALAGVDSTGNDFLDTDSSTPVNISGQVRYDADKDGNLADAESGINGVTVALYADDGTGKPTGAALQTTTTDSSGNYTFTNVAAGNYVVVETNPSGTTSTNDKDGAASNSLDQVAVALAGVPSTGNDFLDVSTLSISGQVRNDADYDGNLADVESGISGVTVALYAGDGAGNPISAVLATTTTDASGNYTFTNVAAGNYTVAQTNLSGYRSTNDKDGAGDTSDRIAVALAGANSTGNDFLDTNVASISGQVRNDADNDGVLADAESGIGGVTFTLYADDGTGQPTGAALQTATTFNPGTYTFINVAAGAYVVVETNLSGYASTNDKDGVTRNTRDQVAVALPGSVNSTGNDFLDTNVASISGQVRNDADSDGDLADAESGINGVTVALYADNGAGQPTGAALATTTANSWGYYAFTNRAAGNYVVVETNPSGYASTNDKDGATSNTRDQIVVALVASVNSTGNDFLDSALDFGDLPAAYKTLLADDGPRHSIVPGAPYLGTVLPDAETDGQPNATAIGDDVNGSPDDEDGVTVAAGKAGGGHWTNGTVAGNGGGAVNVTISAASACLGAFMDFNGSGSLSAVTLRDATGAAASQPIAAGSYTFYFDVPANTFTGSGGNPTIYGRFRVTSPVSGSCTGSTAYSATGAAPNGEVEDYAWGFTPNAVTLLNFQAQTLKVSETFRVYGLALGGLVLLDIGVAGLIWRRLRRNAKKFAGSSRQAR